MRRALYALLPLLAILGFALAARAANEQARCHAPHPGKTIRRTRYAWLWNTRDSPPNTDVYACAFDVGRRETLTPGNGGGGCEGSSPCDVASGYALARDVVAWALDHCGVAFDMGCGGGTVQSLDLRTGKRIRTASSPDNSSPSIHTVVKTDGAIAWVARNVDPNYYDVYRSDGRGTRHLERSPSVDPRSLTLRSSTIVWLDKGQRHFASLR